MTKEQLYQLPDFGALFTDPRMKGVIEHLKTELPKSDKGTLSGDWYRGLHETIRAIEELGNPPRPSINLPSSRQQYADIPTASTTLNRAF